MVTIKIPAKIQVGGHYFNIVHNSDIDAGGDRAKIDFKRLVISLHPEKHPTIKGQSLIHEFLHAVIEIYLNGQIQSEDMVEPLSEGLWQIFQQLEIEFDYSNLTDETRSTA